MVLYLTISNAMVRVRTKHGKESHPRPLQRKGIVRSLSNLPVIIRGKVQAVFIKGVRIKNALYDVETAIPLLWRG